MTIVTKIFSALGNNSTLTPIVVKDGFDISGRTAMAYNQGKKAGTQYAAHDAREMFFEETITSSVWLGGIPALKVLFDKFVTNKVYKFKNQDKYGKDALAKLDLKLLDSKSPQALKLENIKDTALKVELEKVLKNTSKFKKFFATKAAVATLIPLALIGFILPKVNYAITGKIVKKEKEASQKKAFAKLQEHQSTLAQNNLAFASFMGHNNNKNVAFGSAGEAIAKIFMNPVTNMAILDAGISSGRLATSRNKFEAIEKGIKEAGIITFMYLGGPYIAKGFEWLSQKVLKKPISLDSKIIEDKCFMDDVINATKVKAAKAKIEEFIDLKGITKGLSKEEKQAIQLENEKKIIDFIDNELKANKGKVQNYTLKTAQKLGIIDIIDGARNPLKLINTEKLAALNGEIKEFVSTAAKSDNVEKFVKSAKFAKRGAIVANIALCSTALAFVLPKLQYWFREKFTKTAAAPGLQEYYQ